MTQETTLPQTLEIGDYYGHSGRGFTVTQIDLEQGVYKGIWDGEYYKSIGNRQTAVLLCPEVVIPISKFEYLNSIYTEEGVMYSGELPVKLYSAWRKNKNF
jgi:hypothetical protein